MYVIESDIYIRLTHQRLFSPPFYLRLPTYRAGQATKFPDFIVALSSIQNAANALAPDIHLLILAISFPNHRSIRVSDESIA
ncbi:hypothetical protein AFLA_005577 [Aspergillus flavus NRRL3357]|nr:hypothetical protein AFLA_005577 [Aspergillus flavus NRRL3357]